MKQAKKTSEALRIEYLKAMEEEAQEAEESKINAEADAFAVAAIALQGIEAGARLRVLESLKSRLGPAPCLGWY